MPVTVIVVIVLNLTAIFGWDYIQRAIDPPATTMITAGIIQVKSSSDRAMMWLQKTHQGGLLCPCRPNTKRR